MSNLSITLPVISNIEEAREWNKDFKSILTVGPRESEVQWNHPNHRVFEFGDITSGPTAPKIEDIRDAVMWGAEQEDLLVHCHAGMSRSTATAWGISIARGADPTDSFISLKKAHPGERWGKRSFIPNKLIVKHLMEIFNLSDLEDIRREHSMNGWFE
jgi:predicted protein tyrosine phosphatase